MQMKRAYAIFYLLAIAMYALSVTVCVILAVKVCMTLELAKVECKYANGKATYDFYVSMCLSCLSPFAR